MCRLHLNFLANEKLSKTNPTLSQTDYDAGQFFSDLIFFFLLLLSVAKQVFVECFIIFMLNVYTL